MDELKTKSSKPIKFTPDINDGIIELISLIKKFPKKEKLIVLLRELEGKLEKKGNNDLEDEDLLKQRLSCLVLSDLMEQGWNIRVGSNSSGDDIYLYYPNLDENLTNLEKKDNLRKILVLKKNQQIVEKSVQQFLKKMIQGSKQSILKLIDDGKELSNDLKNKNIAEVIEPELQIINSAQEKEEITNLYLNDIWRFFRHTWSLPYKTTLGRNILFLIRNKKRPNRPIMGIGSISNPILRLNVRDKFIGWEINSFLHSIRNEPKAWKNTKNRLLKLIDKNISNIRSDDFFNSKKSNYKNVIQMLLEIKETAIKKRKDYYEKRFSKIEKGENVESIKSKKTFLESSQEPLFIKKRADQLLNLFIAKKTIENMSDDISTIDFTNTKTNSKTEFNNHRALSIALQYVRQSGLATNILDLNVCGAVPPYNDLLVGKLVAMSPMSNEINKFYSKKYGKSPSEISSNMAGRAIIKNTTVKMYTTTSLYAVGSSQYNRIKLDFEKHLFTWKKIGKSEGVGSIQFSKKTTNLMRYLYKIYYKTTEVHGIFGEGTSPLLRMIRMGLAVLGLKHENLVYHNTPRIVYALEMYNNCKNDLMNDENSEDPKLPFFKYIAKNWEKRWLNNRVKNEEVLDRIAKVNFNNILTDFNVNKEFEIKKSDVTNNIQRNFFELNDFNK